MKIEHIAVYTRDLEKLKDFYVEFFGGQSNEKYTNPTKEFESYFLTFDSGARLEIMQMLSVPETKNKRGTDHTGLIHLAFSTGSREHVDVLTTTLQERGYPVVSAPRETGDGYYESCVLDPDGNRVEITE